MEENSIKDITNTIEEDSHYYRGVITNINSVNIVFENLLNNEKYSIDINDDFKFINIRTNEEINIDDIKVDYYIDTYTYKESNVIGILTNIKGEELKKELLENMALENPIYLTVSPVGLDIEIINTNKAILTISFSDLLDNYNTDGGTFEIKVELNSDTVLECKEANKIEELENETLDIIKIKIDKNTIDDKIPIVTYFMSSNGN